MSGSDFDFRPPTERREPKQFEPPPWEREAFEGIPEAQPNTVTAPAQVDEQAPKPVEKKVARRDLDDGAVAEMLAGLAEEDPPSTQTLFGVSMATALLLSGIGVVLLVWAMAALVGSRNTGTFGVMAGAALALFGATFIAGGFWLAFKTLKRRGVL